MLLSRAARARTRAHNAQAKLRQRPQRSQMRASQPTPLAATTRTPVTVVRGARDSRSAGAAAQRHETRPTGSVLSPETRVDATRINEPELRRAQLSLFLQPSDTRTTRHQAATQQSARVGGRPRRPPTRAQSEQTLVTVERDQKRSRTPRALRRPRAVHSTTDSCVTRKSTARRSQRANASPRSHRARDRQPRCNDQSRRLQRSSPTRLSARRVLCSTRPPVCHKLKSSYEQSKKN